MMKLITTTSLLLIFTLVFLSCDQSSNENNSTTTPESFVFDNDGSGCSNFLVYESNDQFYTIHISGRRDSLGISTVPMVFDLPNDQLQVVVNQFDGLIGNYYCDDVVGDEGTILNSYSPISGSAEIVITQDSIFVNDWELIYEISISLDNLIFDVNGDEVEIKNNTFSNVRVGWFPG